MFNFAFLLETASDSTTKLGFDTLFPIILLGIMVIFMIVSSVRAKKKRDADEKAFTEMKDNLQPGDEVTTIGGIIGKVVSVKGDTFVLETTKDKTKIRFLKGAIGTIDVKAADLAAQVIEAKEEALEESEPAAEATEENN